MLEIFVLVLLCLLGFAGAAPWVILLGTAGLCIGPFSIEWGMLKKRPLVPFDRKVMTFFLGAVGNGLFASGLSYFSGVAGRAILG